MALQWKYSVMSVLRTFGIQGLFVEKFDLEFEIIDNTHAKHLGWQFAIVDLFSILERIQQGGVATRRGRSQYFTPRKNEIGGGHWRAVFPAAVAAQPEPATVVINFPA